MGPIGNSVEDQSFSQDIIPKKTIKSAKRLTVRIIVKETVKLRERVTVLYGKKFADEVVASTLHRLKCI